MTRGTPAQTQYFYSALVNIALDGVLPRDHLLRRCPLDPFESGQTCSERRAVRSLHQSAGNWTFDLRRLWYGYVMSGQRIEHLHAGISILTLYDDERRQLLRSHPEDEQIFPCVHFWDSGEEAAFSAKIRDLDRRQAGTIKP